MSDETNVEPTPPAEGTEPAPVEPASKEDLAAAIKNIENKIGVPAEPDPYSLSGEEPEDFGTETRPLGDTPTKPVDSSDAGALKERLDQLEAENRRLSTRSNLNELESWIKDNRPNAFMPSVKRAIRNGSSMEVIKGIASASHNDVERGKKMLMEELGADLSVIKKAANIKFETNAAEQFGGTPPAGEPGEGGMDIKEYMEKIQSMSGADAEKLMEKVKLSDRNPMKGIV